MLVHKLKRIEDYASKMGGFHYSLKKGIKVEYESEKIPYIVPASNHTYNPDFKLPNGIFVETKGRFVAADRKKHLLVKQQNPELDIRFVFTSSKNKMRFLKTCGNTLKQLRTQKAPEKLM